MPKTDYDARARSLVSCAWCEAKVGEPCRGSQGAWKGTHWVRRRDASARLSRTSGVVLAMAARPRSEPVITVEYYDPNKVREEGRQVCSVYLRRARYKRKFVTALNRLMKEASGWK